MRWSLIPSVLLVGAMAAAAGCTHDVDPKVDLVGRRVVVIPFKSRTEYHFFDPVGVRLADEVTEDLVNHRDDAGCDIVTQSALADALDVDPTEVTLEEIAARVRADGYLTGEIVTMEARRASDFGFYRARAEVIVWFKDLRETGAGTDPEYVFQERVSAEYPESQWTPVPFGDVDEAVVEESLIRVAAHRIGRLLYPYEPGGDEHTPPSTF